MSEYLRSHHAHRRPQLVRGGLAPDNEVVTRGAAETYGEALAEAKKAVPPEPK
jgi:hypothetical protein